MTTTTDLAVYVAGVTRGYNIGAEQVLALRGIDLAIPRGAFVGLMGRSGSGKTTLLNIIGGLDTPSAGEVVLYGQPLHRMSQERLTLLRRDQIGFIFQS